MIIRPKGITRTPRALARALGTETRKARGSYQPQWPNDIFLVYPYLLINDPHYQILRAFCQANKWGQRQLLHTYNVPIPNTVNITQINLDAEFVVRPYRHRGGENFTVISYEDIPSYSDGHYISELFPKRWEYRLIFVKGDPVLTLLKHVPDHLSYNQPWNHRNGSFFVTVRDMANNRLRHTNVFDALSTCPVTQHAHLVAFDILLASDYSWVVTEANFCPALTIEDNLNVVANHLRGST